MPKTILCVDDSPTQLQAVVEALEPHGYTIVTAENGEDALLRVAESVPDLVLLDVVLPKKNGFQVCRQIKTQVQTKDVKVVLVTSKDQPSDRFWGMKQGADDYMVKPVDPDELAHHVERHLG